MNKREVRSTPHTIQKQKQSQGVINDFDNVELYSLRTSNLRIRKLCCMCLRTTKQWSRWLTHRVALDWLFNRINLDTKNPNQIHWHQKPTRRHTDQGKFHTWWMESSFVFVQHHPFQFLPLVLKWCRKEHKKMQVKKESQQNQSWWWIWSRETAQGTPNVLASTASESRVNNQIWKSERTSGLVKCAANKYGETRIWTLAHQTTQNGTLTTGGFLKCGNLVKCRTQVRRDPCMTSLSSMMIWTLTPPQNRTSL